MEMQPLNHNSPTIVAHFYSRDSNSLPCHQHMPSWYLAMPHPLPNGIAPKRLVEMIENYYSDSIHRPTQFCQITRRKVETSEKERKQKIINNIFLFLCVAKTEMRSIFRTWKVRHFRANCEASTDIWYLSRHNDNENKLITCIPITA